MKSEVKNSFLYESMDEQLKSQVYINKNDIDWLKSIANDLKEQSKKQTALLFGILISLIGTITAIITVA